MEEGGRATSQCHKKRVKVEDVAAVSGKAAATAVNTNESLYVLGILLLYRI